MKKSEKALLEKLVNRQKVLYARIKEKETKRLSNFDPTELRQFDQNYGECIGIEKALQLFGIDFKGIDD